MSHPHAHRYSRSHSGCEHLDAEIAKEFCCGITERRTEGQTVRLTGSSWCVGTLRGFVMDLQNLQYYLSEEQLPLCKMDERDDGIRLFFYIYISNNKELQWFEWGEEAGGVCLTVNQHIWRSLKVTPVTMNLAEFRILYPWRFLF